jgi:hypothetical protein
MVRILEVPGLDLDPKAENRRVSRISCSPVVDERAALMIRILEVPGLDLDPKTENRRVFRISFPPTQIPGIVL